MQFLYVHQSWLAGQGPVSAVADIALLTSRIQEQPYTDTNHAREVLSFPGAGPGARITSSATR